MPRQLRIQKCGLTFPLSVCGMRAKKFSQTSKAAANGFIIAAGEDTRLYTLDAIRPAGSSDGVARAYEVVASSAVLRKAVPRVSFDEVGVANVDPSIQVYVGTEVGRVSKLSGARFGLVGVADVGPAIFVGVASKNLH